VANYLQYINMIQNTSENRPLLQFLVSGADPQVRNTVLSNIIATSRPHDAQLFIVDNTRNGCDLNNTTHGYKIKSATSGEISLCSDLLNTSSMQQISRFREVLSILGFDSVQTMRTVSYLSFVRETEKRLGNNAPLTIEVLEEYSATILVEYKLNRLVENGSLSEENHRYLLARYSEVASASADFEHFLVLMAPFIRGETPHPGQAVLVSLNAFANDATMQNLICRLLVSYIKNDPCNSTVLIFDDADGNREYMVDLLKLLPSSVEIHMFSRDIFSLSDGGLSVIMNRFPARVYSRHEDMNSCRKIEETCGEIDVVKRTTTVSRDRRLQANTPIDMLFGINKVETEIMNVPTREPKFRKETIQSFPPRAGILDFAGNKMIFRF